MIEILYTLSAAILGIFAGTQIAEGALLVPYWKSLSFKEFFILHKTFGPKIHNFYAPITIAATVIPVGTAIFAFISAAPGFKYAGIAGILALIILCTYFIYFKKANQSFADVSLSEDELPAELMRWGNWHWGRVCLEVLAFGVALIALVQL